MAFQKSLLGIGDGGHAVPRAHRLALFAFCSPMYCELLRPEMQIQKGVIMFWGSEH